MVARNFFLLLLNNSRQHQAAVAYQNLHSCFAISVDKTNVVIVTLSHSVHTLQRNALNCAPDRSELQLPREGSPFRHLFLARARLLGSFLTFPRGSYLSLFTPFNFLSGLSLSLDPALAGPETTDRASSRREV